MALIRALNSAISGIQSQEAAIDVIGDNLANANTVGFKSSRTSFSTIYSQTLRYGTSPGGNLGGIDPMQIGRGVQVASVGKNFSQGTLKQTGIHSDLAIEGDGFFVLKDAAGTPIYTRMGQFSLNPSQKLHDPATGYIVQGILASTTDFTIPVGGAVTDLAIPVGTLTIAKETTNAIFDGNLNGGGTVAADGTVLISEALYNSNISTPASDSTLLTDLGRSSSTGTFVDLNLAAGDTITLNAKKGGRSMTAITFTVGSPPPQGGSTLGDLRAFIAGALGIGTGSSQNSEQIGAVRRGTGGAEVGDTLDLVGPAASGTIVFSGNGTIGDTVTITDGSSVSVTLTAVANGSGNTPTTFEIGTSATTAAQNIVTAINNNSALSGIMSATSNAGTVTITAVNKGTSGNSYTIAEGVDAGAVMTMTTFAGGGLAAQTDTLTTISTGTTNIMQLVDRDLDFVTEGVQVGDFIRFGSGTAAGQIGRVTAVGTASGLASNYVIRFEADPADEIPVSPGGETYYLHERAGVRIGTGSSGALTNTLDPNTTAGAIRIAGNVGGTNGITDLELTNDGSRLALFTESVEAAGESVRSLATVYDSLGRPHTVDIVFALQSHNDTGNTFRWWANSDDNVSTPGVDANRFVGSGLIRFDENGAYSSDVNDQISITLGSSGANTPFIFSVDWTKLSGFREDGSTANFTRRSGVALMEQDGFEQGTLNDYEIDANGVVNGVFTNGLSRTLGQLVMARFANANGLVDLGNSYYRSAPNSGNAMTGTANTFGRGAIRGGALEESNVDMARQFTDLIVSQRAFQANARTISTASQLLADLVQMT